MGQVVTINEGFGDFFKGMGTILLEIKQKARWLVGMPWMPMQSESHSHSKCMYDTVDPGLNHPSPSWELHSLALNYVCMNAMTSVLFRISSRGGTWEEASSLLPQIFCLLV